MDDETCSWCGGDGNGATNKQFGLLNYILCRECNGTGRKNTDKPHATEPPGFRMMLESIKQNESQANKPTETEYRQALYGAKRGLIYAQDLIGYESTSSIGEVICAALDEVNRVLDIGRDESKEQIAT